MPLNILDKLVVCGIQQIGHELGVFVAEIVQVVCVVGLDFKYVLHGLHLRYVLAIKMLLVVSMC